MAEIVKEIHLSREEVLYIVTLLGFVNHHKGNNPHKNLAEELMEYYGIYEEELEESFKRVDYEAACKEILISCQDNKLVLNDLEIVYNAD